MPTAHAAISAPSMKRCGSRSRYQRSLNVPGSPSSILIAIRRGAGLRRHRSPLAPRGKARAAQATQTGLLHHGHDVLAPSRTVDARGGEGVAAWRPGRRRSRREEGSRHPGAGDAPRPGAGCVTAFAVTSVGHPVGGGPGQGFWPMTALGAVSQRPIQGAGSTRTSVPRISGSASRSPGAPAISQAMELHTRTVIGGGTASPSLTTSKWW